jgi:glycosyltransferase involved in cell wall biosynthesis
LRGKYDVIIDCENGIPFFTPLFVNGKKLLVVFHVHQEVFKVSLNTFVFRLASYIESNVMPRVYKSVKCITISNSAREDMKKLELGTAGITVVSPGIDHEVYLPGKKSSKPTILFVGRLKQYKSIQTLLQAAKKILESKKNVQIIIAGEGEEGTKLKRLAYRLGIKDHVLFTGKVSEEKKVELYQQAWVVVNPSVKEGFGMAVLEANACGAPVVASNVAGLCDSIKHNTSGVLVPYGDVDAFVNETLKILNNEVWRNRLSEGAVKWSKSFSWETSTDAFIKAFPRS